MQNPTTRPTTTCGQHRILGTALVAGVWTCRGCGLPAIEHETAADTVARRAMERIDAEVAEAGK